MPTQFDVTSPQYVGTGIASAARANAGDALQPVTPQQTPPPPEIPQDDWEDVVKDPEFQKASQKDKLYALRAYRSQLEPAMLYRATVTNRDVDKTQDFLNNWYEENQKKILGQYDFLNNFQNKANREAAGLVTGITSGAARYAGTLMEATPNLDLGRMSPDELKAEKTKVQEQIKDTVPRIVAMEQAAQHEGHPLDSPEAHQLKIESDDAHRRLEDINKGMSSGVFPKETATKTGLLDIAHGVHAFQKNVVEKNLPVDPGAEQNWWIKNVGGLIHGAPGMVATATGHPEIGLMINTAQSADELYNNTYDEQIEKGKSKEEAEQAATAVMLQGAPSQGLINSAVNEVFGGAAPPIKQIIQVPTLRRFLVEGLKSMATTQAATTGGAAANQEVENIARASAGVDQKFDPWRHMPEAIQQGVETGILGTAIHQTFHLRDSLRDAKVVQAEASRYADNAGNMANALVQSDGITAQQAREAGIQATTPPEYRESVRILLNRRDKSAAVKRAADDLRKSGAPATADAVEAAQAKEDQAPTPIVGAQTTPPTEGAKPPPPPKAGASAEDKEAYKATFNAAAREEARRRVVPPPADAPYEEREAYERNVQAQTMQVRAEWEAINKAQGKPKPPKPPKPTPPEAPTAPTPETPTPPTPGAPGAGTAETPPVTAETPTPPVTAETPIPTAQPHVSVQRNESDPIVQARRIALSKLTPEQSLSVNKIEAGGTELFQILDAFEKASPEDQANWKEFGRLQKEERDRIARDEPPTPAVEVPTKVPTEKVAIRREEPVPEKTVDEHAADRALDVALRVQAGKNAAAALSDEQRAAVKRVQIQGLEASSPEDRVVFADYENARVEEEGRLREEHRKESEKAISTRVTPAPTGAEGAAQGEHPPPPARLPPVPQPTAVTGEPEAGGGVPSDLGKRETFGDYAKANDIAGLQKALDEGKKIPTTREEMQDDANAKFRASGKFGVQYDAEGKGQVTSLKPKKPAKGEARPKAKRVEAKTRVTFPHEDDVKRDAVYAQATPEQFELAKRIVDPPEGEERFNRRINWGIVDKDIEEVTHNLVSGAQLYNETGYQVLKDLISGVDPDIINPAVTLKGIRLHAIRDAKKVAGYEDIKLEATHEVGGEGDVKEAGEQIADANAIDPREEAIHREAGTEGVLEDRLQRIQMLRDLAQTFSNHLKTIPERAAFKYVRMEDDGLVLPKYKPVGVPAMRNRWRDFVKTSFENDKYIRETFEGKSGTEPGAPGPESVESKLSAARARLNRPNEPTTPEAGGGSEGPGPEQPGSGGGQPPGIPPGGGAGTTPVTTPGVPSAHEPNERPEVTSPRDRPNPSAPQTHDEAAGTPPAGNEPAERPNQPDSGSTTPPRGGEPGGGEGENVSHLSGSRTTPREPPKFKEAQSSRPEVTKYTGGSGQPAAGGTGQPGIVAKGKTTGDKISSLIGQIAKSSLEHPEIAEGRGIDLEELFPEHVPDAKNPRDIEAVADRISELRETVPEEQVLNRLNDWAREINAKQQPAETTPAKAPVTDLKTAATTAVDSIKDPVGKALAKRIISLVPKDAQIKFYDPSEPVEYNGIPYRTNRDGFYLADASHAFINANAPDIDRTIVHEAVHAALDPFLSADPAVLTAQEKAGLAEFMKAYESAKDLFNTTGNRALEVEYAVSSPQEFAAGLISDPRVQGWAKNTNVVNAVGKILGAGSNKDSPFVKALSALLKLDPKQLPPTDEHGTPINSALSMPTWHQASTWYQGIKDTLYRAGATTRKDASTFGKAGEQLYRAADDYDHHVWLRKGKLQKLWTDALEDIRDSAKTRNISMKARTSLFEKEWSDRAEYVSNNPLTTTTDPVTGVVTVTGVDRDAYFAASPDHIVREFAKKAFEYQDQLGDIMMNPWDKFKKDKNGKPTTEYVRAKVQQPDGTWREFEQVKGILRNMSEDDRKTLSQPTNKDGSFTPKFQMLFDKFENNNLWNKGTLDKVNKINNDPNLSAAEKLEKTQKIKADQILAAASDLVLNASERPSHVGIESARMQELPSFMYDYSPQTWYNRMDRDIPTVTRIEKFGQYGPPTPGLFDEVGDMADHFTRAIGDHYSGYNKTDKFWAQNTAQNIRNEMTGVNRRGALSGTLALARTTTSALYAGSPYVSMKVAISRLVGTASYNGLSNSIKGLFHAVAEKQGSIDEARELGLLGNMGHLNSEQMLNDRSFYDEANKFSQGVLKISGHQDVNNWANIHNLFTVKSWLAHAIQTHDSFNPNTAGVFARANYMRLADFVARRNISKGNLPGNLEPVTLRDLADEANAATQALQANPQAVPDMPLTQKFLQKSVLDTQTSYRLMDNPMWSKTRWGKMPFQFNHWAYNFSRMYLKEMVIPALDHVRDGYNAVDAAEKQAHFLAAGRYLLKASLGAIVAQQVTNEGKNFLDWAFGRDRTEVALATFVQRLSQYQDGEKVLRVLFHRMMDNTVNGAFLGMLPDYTVRPIYNQGAKHAEMAHVWNPFMQGQPIAPVQGVTSQIANLWNKVMAQGPQNLSNQDWDNYIYGMISGVRDIKKLAYTATGNLLPGSSESAGRREYNYVHSRLDEMYEQNPALDPRGGNNVYNPPRSSVAKARLDNLMDAMYAYQPEQVTQRIEEFIRDTGMNRVDALKHIKQYVQSHQPIPQGRTSLNLFAQFSHNNFSEEEFQKFEDAQNNYLRTAYQAGIFKRGELARHELGYSPRGRRHNVPVLMSDF